MWFSSNSIPYHLPKGTGKYIPGVADIMLDYEKEGLLIRLYYPSNAKQTIESQHKKWIPAIPDYDYIAGLSSVAMIPTFLINFAWLRSGKLQIPALHREKLNQDIPKLKLILFSHGLGALRSFYSSICIELASRGYLVAVLEHRDQSACHTYYFSSKEDAKECRKTVIEFKKIALGRGHLEARKEQINYRKDEMLRAYEFFNAINEGTTMENVMDHCYPYETDFKLNDFANRIDMDNVTVAGHSFGAATALLAMSERPTIKFGIMLDPWMFPLKDFPRLERKVNQPLLFINTQTFHIDTNIRAMSQFYSEEDNRKMFTIMKSTHENQTDSVLIAGYWLNWFMRKIDPKLAISINNALILRYLREFVEDKSNDEKMQDYEVILKDNEKHYKSGITKPWY